MNRNTGKTLSVWHKSVIYAACLVLIIFYLTNMWWLLNPKVGIEYQMYYITHELSDWPGYGKLTYSLGTTEMCTSRWNQQGELVDYAVCMRKGKGWERDQKEGSKSCDNESYIYYIPAVTSMHGTLTLQIKNVWCSNGENISIYVNDKRIGSFNTSGTYSFETGSFYKDELLTLRFDTQNSNFLLWSVCLDS